MRQFVKHVLMAEAGAGETGGATGGAASGGADWRAAIAGDDQDTLAILKDIEDPKALVTAHQSNIKWRESIAGDNPDAMKTLERFASPKAVFDSYSELRGRVSRGELRAVKAFPDKGSDEEKAQWRTENGVPADGKYDIKAPEGVQINDADKAVIEKFTKHAHSTNLPAGAVNEVVSWYLQDRSAREEAARVEFDTARRDTAAQLGAEWGAEYKPNLNRIQGMLDATIPADQGDLKENINKAIATNPHFARHYAALALQINPASTLVPGDRGANEGSITDGLKAIDKQMRTDRKSYDSDAGVQQRYRDLLGAYEKLTGKQWGMEG